MKTEKLTRVIVPRQEFRDRCDAILTETPDLWNRICTDMRRHLLDRAMQKTDSEPIWHMAHFSSEVRQAVIASILPEGAEGRDYSVNPMGDLIVEYWHPEETP